jgi:demethylmenaquinone methyltransferase/2-methoxy-6-polyprenyl-1,4-benzoquinol methylase
LGGIIGGDKTAYRYLPQSLINFPDARGLASLFKDNGFPHTRSISLIGGVANLHVGTTSPHASKRANLVLAATSA